MVENALTDLFFHSDHETQWQGQVVGPLTSSGHYWLVQTFSWLDGLDSTLHVVSVHTMTEWKFYNSSADMNHHVDQARARWAREEMQAKNERRLEGTEN